MRFVRSSLVWQSLALLSSTTTLPLCGAMTAYPGVVPAEQSVGTPIDLLLNGDEFDSYYTNAEGYTVMQNNRGDWMFAVQHPNWGYMIPTGVRADSPNRPPGLANKHLRPTPAARAIECQGKLCGDIAEHGDSRRLDTSRKLTQTTEDLKNLVVLIRFSDHASGPNERLNLPTESDIHILMNNQGTDPLCPTGSVWNIFNQSSYGTLSVNSTIATWVTVPNTEAYYANGNSGLTTLTFELIKDALHIVDSDPNIDFSDFDVDEDGLIDAITFLHSGYGAEWGGTDAYGAPNTDRIWSHKWNLKAYGSLPFVSSEGVRVEDYHISPAVWGSTGSAIGRIGVIGHELGHFLGLPDLYDTNNDGAGIGSYCLMANSWGFGGSQYYPPVMSAWSRLQLGWATTTTIESDGTITIGEASVSSTVYKIDHNFPSGEYLLIENRQKTGFDAAMPTAGLAIFHIDTLAGYNTQGHPDQVGWPANGNHYRVAMLQADRLYQMEKNANRGDGGDVYTAGKELRPSDSVADGPFPNSDSYQGGNLIQTGVTITNIGPSGSQMTFSVSGIGAAPVTPAPTPEPSSAPSFSSLPSTMPSPAPSLSAKPSLRPSSPPSFSAIPSAEPTSSPSVTPSLRPTRKPTEIIVNHGTPEPTPPPAPGAETDTSEPTPAPTPQPSSAPSLSELPSNMPSLAPSLSAKPSLRPSSPPSLSATPSVDPTQSPSSSSQPSKTPSAAPIQAAWANIVTETFDSGNWAGSIFEDGDQITNKGPLSPRVGEYTLRIRQDSFATTREISIPQNIQSIRFSFWFYTQNVDAGEQIKFWYQTSSSSSWVEVKTFEMDDTSIEVNDNGDTLTDNKVWLQANLPDVSVVRLNIQTFFSEKKEKLYIDQFTVDGRP